MSANISPSRRTIRKTGRNEQRKAIMPIIASEILYSFSRKRAKRIAETGLLSSTKAGHTKGSTVLGFSMDMGN